MGGFLREIWKRGGEGTAILRLKLTGFFWFLVGKLEDEWCFLIAFGQLDWTKGRKNGWI
ncbi:hypothetical protein COCVIDRAFT_101970 [Bipolaris victoriae FI3]|uniref:Uncharacterized protein n=1 Tax=Bipolaris victoriae (strain FI3) TaxID=930091 RepID=W7EGZ2_BIPV3|nr:hypothetical protein COCVIDRAFT_101970 [Bipolaris victoriae FI3]